MTRRGPSNPNRDLQTIAGRPCRQLNRHWTYAIVRGSHELSAGQKLLYGVLLELDRPDLTPFGGAFMTRQLLADEIGMNTHRSGSNHVQTDFAANGRCFFIQIEQDFHMI